MMGARPASSDGVRAVAALRRTTTTSKVVHVERVSNRTLGGVVGRNLCSYDTKDTTLYESTPNCERMIERYMVTRYSPVPISCMFAFPTTTLSEPPRAPLTTSYVSSSEPKNTFPLPYILLTRSNRLHP